MGNNKTSIAGRKITEPNGAGALQPRFWPEDLFAEDKDFVGKVRRAVASNYELGNDSSRLLTSMRAVYLDFYRKPMSPATMRSTILEMLWEIPIMHLSGVVNDLSHFRMHEIPCAIVLGNEPDLNALHDVMGWQVEPFASDDPFYAANIGEIRFRYEQSSKETVKRQLDEGTRFAIGAASVGGSIDFVGVA